MGGTGVCAPWPAEASWRLGPPARVTRTTTATTTPFLPPPPTPGCEPSRSDFRHVELLTTPMSLRMSVAGLVGFQRSTSIHTAYAAAHGEAAAEALLRSYGADLCKGGGEAWSRGGP